MPVKILLSIICAFIAFVVLSMIVIAPFWLASLIPGVPEWQLNETAYRISAFVLWTILVAWAGISVGADRPLWPPL